MSGKILISSIIASGIVRARRKRTIRVGSVFSGIGGLDIGIERAINGATLAWLCESNPHKQRILRREWPDVPIYDDIYDLEMSRDRQDLLNISMLIGGFPCQDVSSCGARKGLRGPRSGKYWEISRLIDEIRTLHHRLPVLVIENVMGLKTTGTDKGFASPLGIVLQDLMKKGYMIEYISPTAQMFGNPQKRRRFFLVAYPVKPYWDFERFLRKKPRCAVVQEGYWEHRKGKYPFPVSIIKPRPMAPDRVNRVRSLGESVIPQVAEWIGAQIELSGILQGIQQQTQLVFPVESVKDLGELDPWDASSIPDFGCAVQGRIYQVAATACLPSHDYPLHLPALTAAFNMFSESNRNRGTAYRNVWEVYSSLNPKPSDVINIAFYQWLMGFPENYTSIGD